MDWPLPVALVLVLVAVACPVVLARAPPVVQAEPTPQAMPADPCEDDRSNSACPCADSAYRVDQYKRMTCRPDQTMEVEWPPVSPAPRVEDEDQQPAIVICVCKEKP